MRYGHITEQEALMRGLGVDWVEHYGDGTSMSFSFHGLAWAPLVELDENLLPVDWRAGVWEGC